MSIAGWSAQTFGDPEWPPLLARIDIRIGDPFEGEGSTTFYFSDLTAERLGIRRDQNAAVQRALRISNSQFGWWNGYGHFAGLVVVVADWAGAGVVGGATYAAAKYAVRSTRRRSKPELVAIATRREAEAFARWMVCSAHHEADCDCPEAGSGAYPASWNVTDDVESPAQPFTIELSAVDLRKGHWTVTLEERVCIGDEESVWFHRIEGVLGPTFFAAKTSWRDTSEAVRGAPPSALPRGTLRPHASRRRS
jgi:hypothetical protein